jgi:hypothetical protein
MSVAFLPTTYSSGLACHCHKGSCRIHDVFSRSIALRRLVLHCVEPPIGRRCSPWSNMSSIESFTGRENTSTFRCRGMRHAQSRRYEFELSGFADYTTCRRDSSCSCRIHHIQTSTSFDLRQERCSFECLSLLGSYNWTREQFPISRRCLMLTRR